MNTSTHRRVAVIGLGAMGGAMAAALHRAGWDVTGFDPSDSARAAASGAGIATTAHLAVGDTISIQLYSEPTGR